MSQRDGDAQGNRYEPERSGKHIFTQILLVGLSLLASTGGRAGDIGYNTYFPINPNVQNEFVLVDNVVNEAQFVQGGSFAAYDMNGNLLNTKFAGFGFRSEFRTSVEDLFPDLTDISYLRFSSGTRVDGWIIQSTSDGEKNAMQQLPHELASKIDVPHVTVNPYWDNQLTLVKTTSKGTPEMLVNPDGVVVNFDGTANNEINLIAPDMTPTGSLVYAGDIGALLRNSSLPSDIPSKYWLSFTNKAKSSNPFSSDTIEKNLVGLLSFFNPSPSFLVTLCENF